MLHHLEGDDCACVAVFQREFLRQVRCYVNARSVMEAILPIDTNIGLGNLKYVSFVLRGSTSQINNWSFKQRNTLQERIVVDLERQPVRRKVIDLVNGLETSSQCTLRGCLTGSSWLLKLRQKQHYLEQQSSSLESKRRVG